MNEKTLKEGCDVLNTKVAAIMESYRKKSENDIPVADFFKALMGEDKFEYWKQLRVKRVKIDPDDEYGGLRWHYLELFDGSGRMLTQIDVSDDYYQSLRGREQEDFEDRETRRRKYGLWGPWPGWNLLWDEEKERRLAEDPMAPYVRVFSPTEYFLMAYIPITPPLGQKIPAEYSRKTAQVFTITDGLEKVPVPRGVNRQGAMVTKSRRSRFTTNMQAYQLNRMLGADEKFSCATVMDAEDKIPPVMERIADMYLETPKWLRSSITGVPVNKISEEKRSKIGEWSYNVSGSPAHFSVSVRPTVGTAKYDNRLSVVGGVPKKLEGQGIAMEFVDEFGLHADGEMLLERSSKILADGTNTLVGFLVVGGVTSDNREALETMRRISQNGAAYNVYPLFLGIHHFKYTDAETGWADEQRCLMEVREERKRLKEEGLRDRLRSSFLQDAIHPSDCFQVTGASAVDVAAIQTRIEEIRTQREMGDLVIQRGRFKENPQNYFRPEWQPDSNGPWYIAEHPDAASIGNPEHGPGEAYVAGSDNSNRMLTEQGAAEANAGGGKHSISVMLIGKTWANDIVAMYRFRHADPKEDYLQMLLGSLYYNCRNLPEYNKEGQADFIYTFNAPEWVKENYGPRPFRKWGFEVPVAFRSKSTYRAHWIGSDNSGPLKRSRYEKQVVPFIAKFLSCIPFEEVLSAVAEWDIDVQRNTPDEGMALLMQRVAAEWAQLKYKKPSVEKQEKSAYESEKAKRMVVQRFAHLRHYETQMRSLR